MADQEDVRALEAQTPWDRPAFRADLARLSRSVTAAARAFAEDVRVLSRLAAQVPRCAHDESGATPWTSFRQEIAVARQVSGQAAAADLRIAMRLTSVLPHTLDLLEAGRITVQRARAFVTELEVLDDELAGQLDCDLADRVARLAVWRIKDEVHRAALALDPDTAALRKAAATAERDVTLQPLSDGQACVAILGPAVPLTRWYATLDARARALRQAGDPRNLAALRFDLATSTFPCLAHPPADQGTPQAQAPALFAAAADGSHRPPRDAGTAGGSAPSAGGSAPSAGGSGASAGGSGASAGGSGASAGGSWASAGGSWPSAGGCGTAGDPGAAAAPAGASAAPTRTSRSSASDAAAGLRLAGVEAASVDCRMSRPVQAVIVVPVETALGLSNEPAWLDGYGWIDAPTSRVLLPDAELRQLCIDGATGQVLDLAPRDVRPPPTPVGVRGALLDMVTGPTQMSDTAWRTELEHDPPEPMREFTVLRDRACDGATQPRSRASTCDQDHDRPHPQGPTAAWNLACRARRTHQLKHYGWTPIRTASGTIWTSPAGQVVDVPHHRRPAPGIDVDPTGRPGKLCDPDELAAVDTDQLTAAEEQRPWLPPQERAPKTEWTVVPGSDEPPPW